MAFNFGKAQPFTFGQMPASTTATTTTSSGGFNFGTTTSKPITFGGLISGSGQTKTTSAVVTTTSTLTFGQAKPAAPSFTFGGIPTPNFATPTTVPTTNIFTASKTEAKSIFGTTPVAATKPLETKSSSGGFSFAQATTPATTATFATPVSTTPTFSFNLTSTLQQQNATPNIWSSGEASIAPTTASFFAPPSTSATSIANLPTFNATPTTTAPISQVTPFSFGKVVTSSSTSTPVTTDTTTTAKPIAFAAPTISTTTPNTTSQIMQFNAPISTAVSKSLFGTTVTAATTAAPTTMVNTALTQSVIASSLATPATTTIAPVFTLPKVEPAPNAPTSIPVSPATIPSAPATIASTPATIASAPGTNAPASTTVASTLATIGPAPTTITGATSSTPPKTTKSSTPAAFQSSAIKRAPAASFTLPEATKEMTYAQLQQVLTRFQYDVQEQESAFIDHAIEVNGYDRQLRRNEANLEVLVTELNDCEKNISAVERALDLSEQQSNEIDELLKHLEAQLGVSLEKTAAQTDFKPMEFADQQRKQLCSMMLSVDAQIRLAGGDLNDILRQLDDTNLQRAALHSDSQGSLRYVTHQLKSQMQKIEQIAQKSQNITNNVNAIESDLGNQSKSTLFN